MFKRPQKKERNNSSKKKNKQKISHPSISVKKRNTKSYIMIVRGLKMFENKHTTNNQHNHHQHHAISNISHLCFVVMICHGNKRGVFFFSTPQGWRP